MLSYIFTALFFTWFGWRLPVGIKAYRGTFAQAAQTTTPATWQQAALAGLKAMFGDT